ncbi:hypothetical protein Hanom_Chr00s023011g01762281 [Helianthus anomalus]
MNVADQEDEPVVEPLISPVTEPIMEREIFEEVVNNDFNDNRRETADFVGVSPKNIEEGNQSPIIGQGGEGNGFGNDGGNHCHNLGVLKSVNVLKRKKYKKIFGEVRCDSGGHYSSSNDRPTKGFKNNGLSDDDPFNLNPFILGQDSNVLKSRGMDPVQTSNSFQAPVG